MSIPYRVQDYLARRGIPWDPLAHEASRCALDAAHLAHVDPGQVAKAVVLETPETFLMAVVPADHRVDLDALSRDLDEPVVVASERALDPLLPDCSPGAVPPLGDAYGLRMLWDPALGDRGDVYFEGGDHRTLVHLDGPYFAELMRGARMLPGTH